MSIVFKSLCSPVAMIGTACKQVASRNDLPKEVIEHAEKCSEIADEAATVVAKYMTDSTIRAMWKHGQSFVYECAANGIVSKNNIDTNAVLLSRLVAGNLGVDMLTHKTKLRKYPLWKELLDSSASLSEELRDIVEDRDGKEYERVSYIIADRMSDLMIPKVRLR